jgi:hypothetical protein
MEAGSLVEGMEAPSGIPNTQRHGVNAQRKLDQPMEPIAGFVEEQVQREFEKEVFSSEFWSLRHEPIAIWNLESDVDRTRILNGEIANDGV